MKKFISTFVCFIMLVQAAVFLPATVSAESVDLVQTFCMKSDTGAAISGSGNLFIWGDNEYGQLGSNIGIDSNILGDVVLEDIKSVSLGHTHAAAISNDNKLYIWGNNKYGQIGTDYASDKFEAEVYVDIKAVSLGGWHSAAIADDNSLWLWGSNNYGQIGNGTTTNQPKPVKIMDNVKAVSLGVATSAAIKTDGSLWMWGCNDEGEIGDGTIKYRTKPVKIMDNVAYVSLGGLHCAAIKTDGSLWVWGYNNKGQVGNGTRTDVLRPVNVLNNVVSVSLGYEHSAAITSDGNLWAWGDNSRGQLGDGTTSSKIYPAYIKSGISAISLGDYTTAAYTSENKLWLWGANESGQLASEKFTRWEAPGNNIVTGVRAPYFASGNSAPASTPPVNTPDSTVNVTLPNFRVYVNDVKIDSRFLMYPYIVYNGITYFPMTYDGARFLGLNTSWSQTNGLAINKLNMASVGAPDGTLRGAENKDTETFKATIASGNIMVNGKYIDNSREQYPLLVFRDVTYFPLTWRFAVDEFGWQYSFTEAKGLVIKSTK